jgi:ketosteroid isomerase-like protein
MDSPTAPVAAQNGRVGSHNLETVKEAFDAFNRDSIAPGIDLLLRHAHDGIELRPYSAPTSVLRGHDAVRVYFRERLAHGAGMSVRGRSFVETGDEVLVDGSLRTTRPDGGLSESQISWTFRFEDGLLREVRGRPRGAA